MAKFIVICGSTASGKSALALRVAQKLGAVIVNCDSQQIYKDLPIISAQPTEEEFNIVPHSLYSTLSAEEVCDTGRYLNLVKEIIAKETRPIIFCGGTGLYINALMNGLSPIPDIPDGIRSKVRQMSFDEVKDALGEEADEEPNKGNPQRLKRALEVKLATGKPIKEWQKVKPEHNFLPDDFLILYLNAPRAIVYEKINDRFVWQVENGALDEAKALMEKNLPVDHPILKAHGTPELIKYIKGEITLEEAIQKAQTNVRNYAKRQQTWFNNQLQNKHEVADKSDEEILKIIDENIF